MILLTPEHIVDLALNLRQAGYSVGPDQCLSAQRMMVMLASQGASLEDHLRLKTLLAPIFCGTPSEQADFYEHYDRWMASRGEPVERRSETPTDKREMPPSREQRAGAQTSTVRRSFAIAAILILIAGLGYLSWDLYGFVSSYTPQGHVVDSENRPLRPSPPSIGEAIYARYRRLISIVATVSPLMLLGLWMLWMRLPRLQLIRWKTHDNPKLDSIRVKNDGIQLFSSALFRRTAQELRRHRRVDSKELDADRIAIESARRGGWFTPAYRIRKERPDYLLLVDRAGFRDSHSRLIEELISKLRQDNVEVTCYCFYGDPRICYPEHIGSMIGAQKIKRNPQSADVGPVREQSALLTANMVPNGTKGILLQDLAASHPAHHLLIFSDAAGLFSSLTGRFQYWIDLFFSWSFRVFLMPEDMLAAENGYRIRVLEDQGFHVVPANESGLSQTAQLIYGEADWKTGRTDYSSHSSYPSLLRHDESRWVGESEPDPPTVNRLLAQLRSYLGIDGFNWLCACAVYPELLWDITLFLGHELNVLAGSSAEQRVSTLLRLPWFRLGSMPNWLRERLIAALPVEKRNAIREALWRLLRTALLKPLNVFELPYAHDPAEVTRRFGRTWLKHQFLMNYFRTEPPASPLRDYVFLAFLQNKNPSKGLPVPDELRKLWGRFGNSRLPLIQGLVAIAATVVIAALVWINDLFIPPFNQPGHWTQVYDPLGHWWLSTLVASLPIVVLFGLLAGFRVKPHLAAMAAAVTALIVATPVFGMPFSLAAMSFLYGLSFGVLKVAWVMLAAVYFYELTVYTGQFERMKESLGSITEDRRLQLLLVAFCFGAFLEGCAGFSTPVAIASAFMVGLGFSPFHAAVLNLIANTASVAWGAIGTPVHTLAAVVGNNPSESDLNAMIGRILPITCVIVPFWLVRAMVSWKETWEVAPAILVVGGSFGAMQFFWANYRDSNLVDIMAGAFSLVVTVIFLKFWKPKNVWRFPHEPEEKIVRHSYTGRQIAKAWMPFAVLSLFVFLWGYPPVKKYLNQKTTPAFAQGGWDFPIVHKAISRDKPVVAKPTPENAKYDFNWLTATGTACFLAALVSGLLLGVPIKEMFLVFGRTLRKLKFAIIAIGCMLGLGYLTRYSGMDAVLGLAFTRTGWLFPFFGTFLGWLGVALTGSDTSSNALFGSLQKITSQQLNIDPILMCAANSAGGVMGKMVDAQSICVATAATNTLGTEGSIFRKVFWHSVALASIVGIIVMLYAYVFTNAVPHGLTFMK